MNKGGQRRECGATCVAPRGGPAALAARKAVKRIRNIFERLRKNRERTAKGFEQLGKGFGRVSKGCERAFKAPGKLSRGPRTAFAKGFDRRGKEEVSNEEPRQAWNNLGKGI